MATEQEYLKINFSKKIKEAEGLLRVVLFKDGDFEIAYMPSLNLSGYGNTEEESLKMLLEIVFKDYIHSLMQLPEAQIMAELCAFGWERKPFLSKQLRNAQFLSTEQIKENFNLPAETQFHERFIAA